VIKAGLDHDHKIGWRAGGSHEDFFSPNLAIIFDVEYFNPVQLFCMIFLGGEGVIQPNNPYANDTTLKPDQSHV